MKLRAFIALFITLLSLVNYSLHFPSSTPQHLSIFCGIHTISIEAKIHINQQQMSKIWIPEAILERNIGYFFLVRVAVTNIGNWVASIELYFLSLLKARSPRLACGQD